MVKQCGSFMSTWASAKTCATARRLDQLQIEKQRNVTHRSSAFEGRNNVFMSAASSRAPLWSNLPQQYELWLNNYTIDFHQLLLNDLFASYCWIPLVYLHHLLQPLARLEICGGCRNGVTHLFVATNTQRRRHQVGIFSHRLGPSAFVRL